MATGDEQVPAAEVVRLLLAETVFSFSAGAFDVTGGPPLTCTPAAAPGVPATVVADE